MSRPRLLDLFSGAGGSARGYQEAGFYVVGVDLAPQPRYVGDEFYQADALTFPLDGFDVVHASPPCQAHTAANNIHGRTDHPDLIPPTRARLQASGLPYIIENVERAPLQNWTVVCGLALGLNVKRHRWFESNIALMTPPCPKGHPGDWVLVFGDTVLERGHQIGRTAKGGPIIHRKHLPIEVGRQAMGIDWMDRYELSEAIPPAYTRHLGAFLLEHLKAAA